MSNEAPATPPSVGQSDVSAEVEKLKADKAELEKAVKGIKADLLSEREKRQQLEQRSNPAPQSGNTGADPIDALFQKKVVEYAAPLIAHTVSYEKAKQFVAGKAGIDPDAVEESDTWKELDAKARRMGLVGSPDKVAKTAWELLQAEKKAEAEAKAKAEEERAKAISGQGSVSSTTTTPPSGSQSQMTESELAAISDRTRLSDALRDIKSGKIKYIPGK